MAHVPKHELHLGKYVLRADEAIARFLVLDSEIKWDSPLFITQDYNKAKEFMENLAKKDEQKRKTNCHLAIIHGLA
jgi:hypothetical protein